MKLLTQRIWEWLRIFYNAYALEKILEKGSGGIKIRIEPQWLVAHFPAKGYERVIELLPHRIGSPRAN